MYDVSHHAYGQSGDKNLAEKRAEEILLSKCSGKRLSQLSTPQRLLKEYLEMIDILLAVVARHIICECKTIIRKIFQLFGIVLSTRITSNNS